MRIDLYELETAEAVSESGAADDAGGEAEPVSPEATPGAGAVSPEAEAASPQAPAEIDWDSPDVQVRLAEISRRQLVEAAQQWQPQEEQFDPAALDPFDEGYTAALLGQFRQMLDERLGPISATVGEFQGERIQSQVGSLVSETAAAYADRGIAAEEIELLGNAFASRVDGEGEQAVRSALKQGADWLTARDQRTAEKAVADYKTSLNADGEGATPYEPGIRSAGLGTERPPRDELDYVRRLNAQTAV